MIINFVKFKLSCIVILLNEIREVTNAVSKSNWLRNNADNKYSYVINNICVTLDATEVLDMPSIPVAQALYYKLPGSTFIYQLPFNNDK